MRKIFENSSVQEFRAREVPNYQSDNLHLELWALYPVVVNQVQKIISKENVPHNLSRKYFVGHVVQDIKSIPCNGQDFLWLLKKGAQRCYTRGKIQVHIQLSSLKKQNHHLHIYIHLTLLLLCYRKQLDKIQSSKLYKNWLEILPTAALTLIQQHAIQHGITPIEQFLCSWLVASTLKIRNENHISFYFLKYLLEILMINVSENSLETYLEEALYNSIHKVFEYALDMLRKLHENFQIQNVQMQDDFFCMLKCIYMICAEMETHYQKPDLYKIVEV
ncbi:uncharacterized protein LOC118201073 [Stegodyphus dumicola]|uniref:uncharacterized protein LOC118201073 n=1 Tax=Stegodyphus dumicola TaxID=202533 RepID=UPI0015B1CF98|nr:uncharacterized protein LOC118201073 [Stegodyphus dumicola]